MSTYALVFDATVHFTSLDDPVEGETTVLDRRNGTKSNLTVAQRRGGMKGLQFGVIGGLRIPGVPLRKRRDGGHKSIHFRAKRPFFFFFCFFEYRKVL